MNKSRKKEKIPPSGFKYFHPDMDDWWYRDFFEREKALEKKGGKNG